MTMKKVIFIGNSFIYYGGCVYKGKYWKNEIEAIDYDARSNDHAYFYRICEQYGVDVKVTDATHGVRVLANFTPAGDGKIGAPTPCDLFFHGEKLIRRSSNEGQKPLKCV